MPLLQQGHLELVAQDSVQTALSISKDGDSTASLGSLCPCSVTLTVKKSFLMFRRTLLCFSLCPWPLVLSTAQHLLRNQPHKPQGNPSPLLYFKQAVFLQSTPATLASVGISFLNSQNLLVATTHHFYF